jgi:hypothetical protein
LRHRLGLVREVVGQFASLQASRIELSLARVENRLKPVLDWPVIAYLWAGSSP